MSDTPSEMDIATVSATTHVDSSRASLKWDMQNVDMVFPNRAIGVMSPERTQEFYSTFESDLKSPMFVTNLGSSKTKKCEQKWFVKLSAPNISNSNVEENYISFYLHREDLPQREEEVVLDERPFRLDLSVHVLGEGNREHLKRSTRILSTQVNPNSGGWGFPKFVSLKSLWENGKTYYLVNENVLRIRVQLTVFGYPVTESGVIECVTSVARNKLTNDMRELLESGKNSDITFICGDREILAHSTILKGRCDVFDRMLETGMIESTTKTIQIEDVDPIVFEAFLEFIYTAEVELSVENLGVLFGLVRVADKYGVDELKAICFKYICERISDENAGEIAVLSLEHNAGDNLRSRVVTYCRLNWFKLSQLEAFKACVLENPLAFFD